VIYLSALLKACALVWWTNPLVAAGCWVVGLLVDVGIVRRGARESGRPPAAAAISVVILNLAAWVIGSAARETIDVLSLTFKDGIPGVSHAAALVLHAAQLPVAVFGGDLHLTTMAGSLSFPVSIDRLGLVLPACVAAIAASHLLLLRPTFRDTLRDFAWIAGVLVAATLIRFVAVTAAFVALCEFVSSESDELPIAPFVWPAAIALSYLPFLLAGWLVLRRQPAGRAADAVVTVPSVLPARSWAWAVVAIALLATFWAPTGTRKDGKLLISTSHTRWSHVDRAYDREWFGADSGYNYACLRRLYEAFHDTELLDAPITAAALGDASVLLIYDPDRAFTAEEIHAVHDFVDRGGGLFLIGDHTNVFGSTSHLNQLCEPLGFVFRDDVLFDFETDFHQLIEVPEFAPGFLAGTSFFKLRGPASIRPSSPFTRTLIEVGNAKSFRAIYSVDNFYPPPHDHPRMRTGRFCVSASSRYGRGRVVAFADSTVFSNFEIFYPGKYEYLLHTAEWLRHSDGRHTVPLQRAGAMVAVLLMLLLMFRSPSPRQLLGVLVAGVLLTSAVHLGCRAIEQARTMFPHPVRPARFVFFAADAEDPTYVLRDQMSEEPYDRRYDVFIQWVLRTGAFSAFRVTGEDAREGLFEGLAAAEHADRALALIVRDADDLAELGSVARSADDGGTRLLLLFSNTLAWEDVAASLEASGVVTSAAELDATRAAWPEGEALLREGDRTVLLAFSAERFSDLSMGISEKVVPTEEVQAAYGVAFSLIDRLFGTPSPDEDETPPTDDG